MAKVSICLLLYGDYPDLARQSLESIRRNCPRDKYQLIVGTNAIGNASRDYLTGLQADGAIDHWVDSPINLNKCPMMRKMFERVDTDFIWWFDDDSFISEPTAFTDWLRLAENSSSEIAMWGLIALCDSVETFAPDVTDPVGFVRKADWYRGLPPPSWRPGGKGEFDFAGLGIGDGRWYFAVGGCWMIRTSAIRTLNWPDPRIVKMGDDAFLGEAIRQQGWLVMNAEKRGVVINSELRRGDPGMQPTGSR